MKKLILLSILLSTCSACSVDGIGGKKLYVFDVDATNTSASECEMRFVSNDVVELRKTMTVRFSDGNFTVYRDKKGFEKTFNSTHYTYKDNMLEMPEISALFVIEKQPDSSYLSDAGEFLFENSILDIPGEQQKARVLKIVPRPED